MTFSIVTISFNQKAFLEEAIISVLNQDVSNLEYIVVDPGSTDGSRELIQRYADRLAATIFEPDHGAPDGLNKGFARATGTLCGFLNSDDVLLPGALGSVASAFEAHPDCDIVMGNGFIVDRSGRPICHVRAGGFTVKRYFYGGATWLQQATFFRRGPFEETGGFNPLNRSCWDGELVLEMARRGCGIHYLNRDLALFRVHPSSITGSRRHKQIMQADADRMFQNATGRRWNRRDTMQSYLFRAERLLTQPEALTSAFRSRWNRISQR